MIFELIEDWLSSKTQTERNKIGWIFWFIVSIIFSFFTEIFMILTEYGQYYWNRQNPYYKFEWNDVARYSVAIFGGSLVNFLIIKIFF